MKQFRVDMFALLSTTAAITALVGTGEAARIDPFVAPECTEKPYITITQVSTTSDYSHSGRSEIFSETF